MTSRKGRENPAIRDFILRNVVGHPKDIVAKTVNHFNVTRVTINRYIHKLIDENLMIAEGNTRSRSYSLKNTVEYNVILQMEDVTAEDVVVRSHIMPHLSDLPENIIDIYQYASSEMINNVMDHANSEVLFIKVQRNFIRTIVTIADSGVGIFRKIRNAHNLMDERHAILELSKGKLTTDPAKHSGEGIFFTSRMFTDFWMSSHGLFYSREFREDDDGWLTEARSDSSDYDGTYITLEMSNDATHTSTEVFKRHEDDEHGFSKTHVPVRLAKYDHEQLVSRSQAKRVLARFNRFSEVMLDFNHVQTIGQAFADEIFRVFANQHPEVAIIPVRASPEVRAMILHVTANKIIVPNALAPGSDPL